MALLVLPVVLLGGTTLLLVTPALMTLVFLKGSDTSLRSSVFKSATELLYQPLRTSVRRRIKPTLDAVAERGGDAAGGLLILAWLRFG